MNTIFDDDYIREINSVTGDSDSVIIDTNNVRILLDCQSKFLVEKKIINGKISYDFFYVERGDKIKYDSFNTVKQLKKGILAYLRAYH